MGLSVLYSVAKPSSRLFSRQTSSEALQVSHRSQVGFCFCSAVSPTWPGGGGEVLVVSQQYFSVCSTGRRSEVTAANGGRIGVCGENSPFSTTSYLQLTSRLGQLQLSAL